MCTIGENYHQGLIQAYRTSNKKNATEQILRSENRLLAISRIRWRIEFSVKPGQTKEEVITEDFDMEEDYYDTAATSTTSPMCLRSPCGVTSSQEVERRRGFYAKHLGHGVFQGFERDLHYLVSEGLSSTVTCEIKDYEIEIYQLIQHHYHSMDNGELHKDLIRCSPQIHKRQRFDTVLIQMPEKLLPARLHLVFEVNAFGRLWKLARVSYFTPLTRSAFDNLVGMHRYEENGTGYTIQLDTIARSCYMNPIADNTGKQLFYLNDCITGDVDLYLRIASMVTN